jgi:hypothetical protein
MKERLHTFCLALLAMSSAFGAEASGGGTTVESAR